MSAARGGRSLFSRLGTRVKETLVGFHVPKAPFDFAVQVGDPVLRLKTEMVKPEDIKSPEITELISKLTSVMRRNRAYGMSAPQVGVPLQVFVTELTKKEFDVFSNEDKSTLGIMPWSYKVFINPKMTVEDSSKTTSKEACLSISGFAAHVPRALKVKVEGLDEDGEPQTWSVSHFGARVVQHEMDHLNGRLFIDTMDPRTFQFMLWKYVQELPRARKSFGG